MYPNTPVSQASFQQDANKGFDIVPSKMDGQFAALFEAVGQIIQFVKKFADPSGRLIGLTTAQTLALAGSQRFAGTATATFLTAVPWDASFTTANCFLYVNGVMQDPNTLTLANVGGFLQFTRSTPVLTTDVVVTEALSYGATIATQLANILTPGQGANLVGVQDAAGLFTSSTVEGALSELRLALNPLLAIDFSQLWSTVGNLGGAQGSWNLNDFKINNLGPGVNPGDAVNLQQLMDATAFIETISNAALLLTGGTMLGPIDMGNNVIANVADAVQPTDALNWRKADTRYLQLTGGQLASGNSGIDMNGGDLKTRNIIATGEVLVGTDGQDAVIALKSDPAWPNGATTVVRQAGQNGDLTITNFGTGVARLKSSAGSAAINVGDSGDVVLVTTAPVTGYDATARTIVKGVSQLSTVLVDSLTANIRRDQPFALKLQGSESIVANNDVFFKVNADQSISITSADYNTSIVDITKDGKVRGKQGFTAPNGYGLELETGATGYYGRFFVDAGTSTLRLLLPTTVNTIWDNFLQVTNVIDGNGVNPAARVATFDRALFRVIGTAPTQVETDKVQIGGGYVALAAAPTAGLETNPTGVAAPTGAMYFNTGDSAIHVKSATGWRALSNGFPKVAGTTRLNPVTSASLSRGIHGVESQGVSATDVLAGSGLILKVDAPELLIAFSCTIAVAVSYTPEVQVNCKLVRRRGGVDTVLTELNQWPTDTYVKITASDTVFFPVTDALIEDVYFLTANTATGLTVGFCLNISNL